MGTLWMQPSSCSLIVIHGNALDATLIMFPNGNTWERFGCNPHHVPQNIVKYMRTLWMQLTLIIFPNDKICARKNIQTTVTL